MISSLLLSSILFEQWSLGYCSLHYLRKILAWQTKWVHGKRTGILFQPSCLERLSFSTTVSKNIRTDSGTVDSTPCKKELEQRCDEGLWANITQHYVGRSLLLLATSSPQDWFFSSRTSCCIESYVQYLKHTQCLTALAYISYYNLFAIRFFRLALTVLMFGTYSSLSLSISSSSEFIEFWSIRGNVGLLWGAHEACRGHTIEFRNIFCVTKQ